MQINVPEPARRNPVLALAALLVIFSVASANGQAADDPWPGPARMQLEASATHPGLELAVRVSWLPPRLSTMPTFFDLQVVDIDAADTTNVEIAGLEVGAEGELTAILAKKLAYLRRYTVRVRGKDDAGVVAPWSPWSPIYVFELPDPDPGPDPGP